jgi:2-aminoethylphosphonate dioxygenase
VTAPTIGTASSALRTRFWQRGWVVTDCILDRAELSALVEEAFALTSNQVGVDPLRHRVPSSRARADRLDPVIDLSARFAALAVDPRLTSLATEILGGPVELLKDKLILKPPGAAGYGLHQDQAYLPDGAPDPDRICVLAVGLSSPRADCGPIEIVPEAHRRLLTSGGPADLTLEDVDRREPVPVELPAGHVLAMHHLAPHQSGPNRSDAHRPILFFTYALASDGNERARYYDAQRTRLAAE